MRETRAMPEKKIKAASCMMSTAKSASMRKTLSGPQDIHIYMSGSSYGIAGTVLV